MAIRTIIIDDEQNARENLKLILNDFCKNVEVVAEAKSAEEARGLIEKHQPGLLFLDINMPNEDGFDLLASIEDKKFAVIFVTAHNQFALKALKAGAIDYIEKPIDIEELQQAIDKIDEKKKTAVDFNTIKTLLSAYKNKSETIAVPTLSGYKIIKMADIVHLEADESYTRIFLADGTKYVSSMTIAKYEKALAGNGFFRVHKSHIVNIKNHLKEFNRQDGNLAIMGNGDIIPVSRRKLTAFINVIKTF